MAQQSWIDETVVWSFTTEASSGITLSVNALSQANTVDNVVVSVEFTLVSNSLSQTNTLNNVPLISFYLPSETWVFRLEILVLTVSDLLQNNSINNIILTQRHILEVNDLSQDKHCRKYRFRSKQYFRCIKFITK